MTNALSDKSLALQRASLDEFLATPLDPEEALEHQRETWGLTAEAQVEAEQTESVLGQWESGATYGDPE